MKDTPTRRHRRRRPQPEGRDRKRARPALPRRVRQHPGGTSEADPAPDPGRSSSIRGVARASALQILAEIRVLPDDLSPRQWVAHAGLDPRTFESGDSVAKPARISRVGNRYLRAALYMPALVASRYEPHVKAFCDELIARGKKPKQALVAVMRKLLHSMHGMLSSGSDFDGERFRALPQGA